MNPLFAVAGIVKTLETGANVAVNGADEAGNKLKNDLLSAIGVKPTNSPAKSTLNFSSIKFPTLPKTNV